MTIQSARPLRRILGLGFGVAFVFGTMVGVGILRLPGTVAAALGDRTLIMVFWALGALYALMGAVAVAELAAMFPETGGFRVYARHAFGEGSGFAIGWCDWLCNAAIVAYVAMTAVTFLGAIWPAGALYPRTVAVSTVAVFTGIHWAGIRIASNLTRIISIAIGLLLMTLVVACFVIAPVAEASQAPLAAAAVSQPLLSMAMLVAVVTSFRAILLSYGGWYAPIYMAEENMSPARTLPRAIIGGALLVAALYLLINFAFLRALPLPVLAASELPAADVARIVLPRGGAMLVTLISLLTILSLLNNVLLMGSRVLYAFARDGYVTEKVASVSAGGTPRVALALTSATGVVLILSGTFAQTIALAAVLFLISYVSAFMAVFVLRHRDPTRQRPYKAFGYPFSTAVVLVGSVLFLIAAVVQDPRSGFIAAIFLAVCAPIYAWIVRRRGPGTAAGFEAVREREAGR
jgi:APA family basic amino acid/polyamine antiporter